MSEHEVREIQPPVQLFKAPADDEGNRSPVKFFGPKGATAPEPAKRQARTSRKKSTKPTPPSTETSASTAVESSLEPRVTPTQIPELDS